MHFAITITLYFSAEFLTSEKEYKCSETLGVSDTRGAKKKITSI